LAASSVLSTPKKKKNHLSIIDQMKINEELKERVNKELEEKSVKERWNWRQRHRRYSLSNYKLKELSEKLNVINSRLDRDKLEVKPGR